MVVLGIITFILFWVAIIWDIRRAPVYDENMNIWEKPIIIKENLFEHNGRTWERIHDNDNGYKYRVFTENLLTFEYKEALD